MGEIRPIAALYVETRGAYFGLPGVDPWDEPRDARKYAGPWPVVAHPPCQRWGRFWHGSTRKPHQFKLGDDGGCFAAALNAVRTWGGVLEHPADSRAWEKHGLMRPPRGMGWIRADWPEHNGWTCYVEQGHYGHASRKPTWLYAHHATDPWSYWLPELHWDRGEQRLPQWMIDRYGYEKARRIGVVAMVGGKDKTRIRNATPARFRDLLISTARSASNVVNCVKNNSTKPYKQINTPNQKEISQVTIEIKFTGEDPAALAHQILTVGFLIRANGAAAAPKKEEPVEAVEAETIDPPKKPGRKASSKKQETVEEVKEDVLSGAGAVDSGSAGPTAETGSEDDATASAGRDGGSAGPATEDAANTASAKMDAVAEAAPPLTIDELRKYTVGYLTFAHKKLDDQKAEFADLLGQFGVAKIGDLPEDKTGAFKALVDARKAKLEAA